MILLATIINKFEGIFRAKYKKTLPEHEKALAAMKICRQAHGPQMMVQCSDHNCGELRYIPHSCGNRSCPHCQNHENWQWIENQLGNLLPACYFLITFTLPSELRNLAFRHQKEIYSLMFDCMQETLKSFTKNDKQLSGKAGFTTILHTHSRRLNFHPHIHVVMPAASVDSKTGLWKKKKAKFIFYHKSLAKVFRAKLLEAIVDRGLPVPAKCPKEWVVDCTDVGKGDKAFIYLGKYLYKGVIQEKDIISCDDKKVTFSYINSETKEKETRTVRGECFLYMLLQHVLPKGFRRTRSYGFLHPCSKRLIKFLQLILRVNPVKLLSKRKLRPGISCPLCGKPMEIIKTMLYRTPLQFYRKSTKTGSGAKTM